MKVRVPDESDGNEVVIVQSTYAPQERHLFELILIADYLKEMGRSITAVVPYLGYARQDKSFVHGESVSVHTVLNMMTGAGISTLVTVNPHKEESLRHFAGKVAVVNAVIPLSRRVKAELDNQLVLAPDMGGLELAKRASAEIGCDYAYIEKKRDQNGNVSMISAHGDNFAGKNVVVFDDIVSTGSTIELAAHYAYSQGAKTVSVAAVHLVMAGDAYERLRRARIDRIFGTNTIPCKEAKVVDVSGEIASVLAMLK